MHALQRTLVSEAEFLALPESMQQVELVDGEVVVSPAPRWWHQEVCRRLVVALSLWADEQPSPFTVIQSPADVRFGPGRILQPDLFVLEGRLPREHTGPITRLPLVCVEVVSSNRIYDRVTKRLIYAAAGVPEYWVVEQGGLIERWTGEGLQVSEEITDQLSTPRLPGLVVDVEALFA
ncbi:MAG: Uma2 family endonuclease [Alphaproteobacteria bacterium]|nr:Uma2 family endonuclease [Alphaproteobacteria bacterium]